MKDVMTIKPEYTRYSLVQTTTVEGTGWAYRIWSNVNNDFFWEATSSDGTATKTSSRCWFLPLDANKDAQRWVRNSKNRYQAPTIQESALEAYSRKLGSIPFCPNCFIDFKKGQLAANGGWCPNCDHEVA